jgi:hypothetical protein
MTNIRLCQEIKALEATANKLFYRASKKTRMEYASKDWKAYRKVYAKLQSLRKEKYQMSQNVFKNNK